MIFDPLDANPWKRAIPTFLMCNILTLLVMWMAFDIAGVERNVINYLLMIVPVFSIILIFVGIIFNQVRRIKHFVLILGIFGLTPIFISCLTPFIAFLIICKCYFSIKIFGFAIYFLALILSALINAKKMKIIEKNIDYLSKQISTSTENFAYIDPKKMREIDFFIKKKPVRKIYEKIVPKLLPLAALGYPLQRLITDVAGHATTFAFLSILSVPLSIYIAGRLAAGYMLWVHLIGCREKTMGVPIFLSK